MKHEHAMCRANDIEQKHLLGGNPTQKEKKTDLLSFSFIFFFAFYFIFVILLYSFFFYFNIEDNVVFKVWGY
jgi:hypothetical protein